MTDRESLMDSIETLLKTLQEYQEADLLVSSEGVIAFVEGWVKGLRKSFDNDNEEGRYGPTD